MRNFATAASLAFVVTARRKSIMMALQTLG